MMANQGQGRTSADRAAAVGVGIVLMTTSIVGIIHGTRASIAEGVYHGIKYRHPDVGVEQILLEAERAHRLYPWSYNLCIYAGETAYYNSHGMKGDEIADRLDAAHLWCGRGLSLNFHKSQLRMLMTRLIERESLPSAVMYWEAFVDWQYWAPYNHLALVDLYAKAGEFDKAVNSLKLTEGTEYHAEARRLLMDAWKRERTPARPTGKSKPRLQR